MGTVLGIVGLVPFGFEAHVARISTWSLNVVRASSVSEVECDEYPAKIASIFPSHAHATCRHGGRARSTCDYSTMPATGPSSDASQKWMLHAVQHLKSGQDDEVLRTVQLRRVKLAGGSTEIF